MIGAEVIESDCHAEAPDILQRLSRAGGCARRDTGAFVVFRRRLRAAPDEIAIEPVERREGGEGRVVLGQPRELRCALGEELPAAHYAVNGRPKVVRWWRMHVLEEVGAPDDEVDELSWLAPQDAVALLDYDHDRALAHAVS